MREGGAAVIVDKNDYYAFGLKHGGNRADESGVNYNYEYNDKELQMETGMYDYGARFYMPDLGRWGVVDPLAEVTPHVSPYHYANNNPVMFNDPTGMLSQSFIDNIWNSSSGTTWYNTGIGFTSSGGNSMDYDGNNINWGSDTTGMLMESVGLGSMGGGGGGAVDVVLEEIIMQGKGNRNTWNNSSNFGFNSAVMGSGILGALNAWNFRTNSSTLHYALENTKIGKSLGEAQAFMFLELPMSFAGGELVAAGWRASGIGRYLCGPIGRLTNGIIKICFTEGTLVATENGNKKIEDIKEGDLVWSYNEETGKKELKKVVELSRNTSSSLVKISVNSTEITCTPEHPFFVNGNWVEAKNLTKDTLLTTLDGTTSPVESIQFLDKKVKVYNFEVEGNHNYYVSEKGILVHNDCGLPQLFSKIESNIIGGEFRYASGESIEFLANHNVKSSTLELTEMAFYPKGALGNEIANTFGQRQMIQSFKVLQNYARENGFSHLRLQFQRAPNSSSANPGHIFDQLIKL
ncbi:Hint domain-containing protein [Chryseobacterium sp. C-71]|uniref:polymorphic toxin-type HINT domain-containing protein n=1 Tax=Chryseobacterium sp. C-71 TaxID=2893882 RepID=UPI001E4D3B8C|nr:polymorphic toxin-type HINT domain-containing protein [Chryseobacterium sp. C-71]UFH33311.1 Hint domain-containing protein [Chryseobacterium sp. C-71]